MEHSQNVQHGSASGPVGAGGPIRKRRRRKHKDAAGGGYGWMPFLRHCGVLLCMRFLIPVGLLALLGAGALYFRLLQGPISLKFLVDPVQDGIAAELPGLTPSVDNVLMALKPTGGLEFRLQNLKVAERDGDLVVAAPYAAMRLSPSAMLSLRAVPTRVELIEPRLFLSYARNTGLKLQFSPTDVPGSKLSGRVEREAVQVPVPRVAQRPVASGAGVTPALEQIELSRVITDFFRHLRTGGASSSYLQAFGLRDATVVLDHEGVLSRWRIQQFAVNLDRADITNILSGSANISSQAGPWSFTFRTQDTRDKNRLDLDLSFDGFYPKTLGAVFPQLSLLKPLDLPVTGNARLQLGRDGAFGGGELALEIGAGRLYLPSIASTPVNIDSGQIAISFDAKRGRVTLNPSTLRWGESSLTLAGAAQALEKQTAESTEEWAYDISAKQGVMTVSEFGIPPTPIDEWRAQGRVQPNKGVIKLVSFKMAVGGGEFTASGEIDTAGKNPGLGIDGKMSAMPVHTIAALWPRAVAPGARKMFGRSVHDGIVRTGSLKILSGRFLRNVSAQSRSGQRVALALELADVVLRPDPKYASVLMPRALVRLESNALEVVVPEASVALANAKKIKIKSGRFTGINIDQLGSVGEIAFQIDSEFGPALALIKQVNPKFLSGLALPIEKAVGQVDGEVRVSFPLDTEAAESQLKYTAKMRLSDGRMENVFGNYDISGATIDFDVTQKSIDARGEVLLNGVLANVNWQSFFDASSDRQPPWRMTSDLDDADRKQLGFDFGDALKGVVPVEFTLQPSSKPNEPVHMRADLTNADLVFEGIAWRKEPGRAAFLEVDLIAAGDGKTMALDNLRLAGDNIAIAGSAKVNEKNEIVAYEFPDFSLDLVTRLRVSGVRNNKKIWKVDASGKTYDGRSFFRSMFNVGRISGRSPRPSPKYGGIDLKVNIDTIIGFSDVSVRNTVMTLSKRAGKLTALKARGSLDGGRLIAAEYRKERDRQRLLLADSTDAGQLFKLIGFYPNVVGGRARLQVNLDGRGPAEKTGILWVEKFRILGDPIVNEVVSNANTGAAVKGKRQRKVTRQVFDFDNMRAPFSVGHGQFVLEDAYMRGPLVGATLRGKVDYNRRSLNIGGTYIPLQGLNNAFGTIPLLGELLSGPRKEGIFGMTFAIQGSMDSPEVLVNPFSFVTPGILREIFQLTPDAPRVNPIPKKSGSRRKSKDGVRSSSSQAIGEGRGGRMRSRSELPRSKSVDGWSSRTR